MNYTYATVIVNNQSLAQRYFEAYFSFGLSPSGTEPATHWLTSGPFSNQELEILTNGTPWVEAVGFGQDPWIIINKIGLKPIAGNPSPDIDSIISSKPIPPASVTPRQMRLALYDSQLLTIVNNAVRAAGDKAQIEWEYAREIRRDNPLITQLMNVLGKTEDQIDELFIMASNVT